MAQKYDRLIKENIAAIFPSLSKKYLGIEVAKSEPIKEKLQQTIEREADFLQKVTTIKGEELMVHLEFQSTDHPKMLERMQLYYTLLKQKYDLPIRQFVIYLGQKPSKMRTELAPSEVFTGFELIDLQTVDYQSFLKANIPEEVLLAVLSNFATQDAPTILAQIIQRLQELSDSDATLQKYTYHLLTLARLRNLSQITQQTLQDMAITYDINQDAFYKQGIEKGMEKGMKKGRQAGIEEGILQIALKMKKADFSTEDIIKVTGLTKAQIDKIS